MPMMQLRSPNLTWIISKMQIKVICSRLVSKIRKLAFYDLAISMIAGWLLLQFVIYDYDYLSVMEIIMKVSNKTCFNQKGTQ